MKPPAPAKGKPSAPRKEPQTRREGGTVPAELQVVYPRRMKPQRAYAVTVSASRPVRGTAEPVVVRPVMPGALVTPQEQKLDVSRPGEQATFYVTPLARGRQCNNRIEVLQGGRPVQAIPLPSAGPWGYLLLVLLSLVPLAALLGLQVAGIEIPLLPYLMGGAIILPLVLLGLRTNPRFLLLLAIVLPALLLYLRANPVHLPKVSDAGPSGTVPTRMPKVGEELGGPPPGMGLPPRPGRPPGGGARPPGAPQVPPEGGQVRPEDMMPPDQANEQRPPPKVEKPKTPKTPGEYVAKQTEEGLAQNLPDLRQNPQDPDPRKPIFEAIGKGAEWTHDTFLTGSEFKQLPFWTFAVLLLMTLCASAAQGGSWTRKRQTVDLAPRAAEPTGVETLPLSPGTGSGISS
jgi:hypothetical protein